MGSIKNYYEMYNKLPFKLFKPNGTEIVLLDLDEKSQLKFIDKLDKMANLIEKKYYDFMVYGMDFIITDQELFEAINNDKYISE